MDLTFQFMAYQSTHQADNESGRLNRGSIICVHNKSNVTGAPNPNGKLMFIHCLNSPFNSLEEAQYLLDPVYNNATEEQEILHRKKWLGDYVKIVEKFPIKYAELRDNKQADMSWDDIKTILVDIETGLYHG
jgi:hypothetical protein